MKHRQYRLSYVSSVFEYPTIRKFWKRYGSKHSLLILLIDDFPTSLTALRTH
jgi:hypothetical protein